MLFSSSKCPLPALVAWCRSLRYSLSAGLDPVTSQKIFELLKAEQRQSNATVVMVSSDLDRLLTVTDRVGMMYRGQLIFDGSTAETKASTEPRVRQFVHGLTEGPL